LSPKRRPKADDDIALTAASTFTAALKLVVAVAERATWRLSFAAAVGGGLGLALSFPFAKPMLLIGGVMAAARLGGHLDDKLLSGRGRTPDELPASTDPQRVLTSGNDD